MNADSGISGSPSTLQSPRVPKPGDFALVKCEDYRCMAVLEPDGVWKQYPSKTPIRGAVKVLQLLP